MEFALDLSRRQSGPGAERPVYFRIADHIRGAVASGDIAAGERLPPIRRLAVDLGVNRDTVALAYDLLAREGLLEATVGRGTFVRGQPMALDQGPLPTPALSPVVERLLDFERARPEYVTRDGAVALHSLTPDPSLYPVKAFRRSLNRAFAEGGSDLLMYGGHRGHDRLREVIAERLCEHGMAVDTEHVVLCQGASQGISLAMQLYTEPGDWIAVEEPTYHNVLGALVGLGLRAAPIPMTPLGPDLKVLERTLARDEVKLFYTMPSFHNPMGVTTSMDHRQRLVALAARSGKPIIEDAFEMDLRYDGRPVTPLAALDPHGLVVHLFSFSKSLFPGVRVGAVTARGRAIDGLLALRHAADLSGVLVLQAAVADFVASGAYDRHLGRLRKTLRERRDAMMESLEQALASSARWTRPDGGYQVWVTLPDAVDTRMLLGEAQRAGVVFAPGYQFNHDGRPSNCLRLTTALADVGEIGHGVSLLGSVVHRHLAAPLSRSVDTSVHV